MGARRTNSPDKDLGTLGAVVLFQPEPEAQGTERRSGNATNHTNPGDVPTDTPDGTELGTQATGASDNNNIVVPPSLTQIMTEDGGNKGGGGNPDNNAQGKGGTVRVRDIEGDKDLACQVLHPCNNQLITVYGNSIYYND